jgi:hypothetical protein
MADISFKIRAEALGKSLENLAPKVEEEINMAVKNLAQAAYTAMVSKMQGMSANPKNRQDYLKSLKFEELGENSYLIHLDGEWANKLEKGFSSYSMKEILLGSTKIVQVGPRTGQPWVQKAKDGHKFAYVPFDHHPYSKDVGGDLGSDIGKLMGTSMDGTKKSILDTFTGLDGKPIDSGTGKNTRPVARVKELPEGMNKNLLGMAKFQKVQEDGKVSSVYMTWRAISETGKDWKHPGFAGYQLFEEAERYVAEEMDNIIRTVLK